MHIAGHSTKRALACPQGLTRGLTATLCSYVNPTGLLLPV